MSRCCFECASNLTKCHIRVNTEKEDSLKLLSDTDVTIISLTKDRDSLSLRIEDLSDQLAQKDVIHERAVQDLKDELARYKKNYRKSQVSLSEKELTLDKLKSDLEAVRSSWK